MLYNLELKTRIIDCDGFIEEEIDSVTLYDLNICDALRVQEVFLKHSNNDKLRHVTEMWVSKH